MASLPVIVFILVYLGMALGQVPGLAVERTGVALIGLIVLLATEKLSLADAGRAVDMPTITLLFALMILSAQFELSGFYGLVGRWVTHWASSPATLLLAIVIAAGVLSAILTNDVVVFALTPLVVTGLTRQGLDARPYLVALAGAANAGSAATLIGNPQNILIGQAGHLDFWGYLVTALPPVMVALVFVYVAVALTWRKSLAATLQPVAGVGAAIDRYQMTKGLVAVAALIGLFLTPFPRDLSALAVAGVLLTSRKMGSREMIGAADWHLLLLFVCLFGITAAFARTGLADQGLSWLAGLGFMPQRLSVMAPLMLAASNTIGNVPAIILILSIMPHLSPGTLTGLALLSTLAGNLLLTGSMCNIIVAERAQQAGARLSFLDFARSGFLMTAASMAAGAFWLWLIGALPL